MTNLELSENHEYRTRNGMRAHYIDYKMAGDCPHLFVIKNASGDGHDETNTCSADLRTYITGEDHDFDIIGYYAQWDKIAVDTKILVRDHPESQWMPAHFAKYEYGKVHAFREGRTSFSVNSPACEKLPHTVSWTFARLVD